MPEPKPDPKPIVNPTVKTLEDLLALVPNKGDSAKVLGFTVTNSGTYYGFKGKGI